MAMLIPGRTQLKARLRTTLIALLTRETETPVDYDQPRGDAGLFGPRSLTWKVHADFPGMMAGGVCALMLQTLHPRALAGVYDHSNFREDLMGRLRRTTAFVAATSYAPQAEAARMIARVAQIHTRVRGVTADGLPYSAADPDLLTWVHVTEMSSFLAGFQRYRGETLTPAARDRYYRETARVAEMLGARRVPKSAAAVARYFARVQPELRFDARSREVLEVLQNIAVPVAGGVLAREVFIGAGAVLLPDWAATLMRRTRLQRLRAEAAARSLQLAGPALRAALSDGVVARSCRRMAVDPKRFQP
ncbi:oxygenase MpaB family protein [Hydrocarboniphaga sp.]|uniref:oxygenase MpaB family protein n=1 Tax=Hydrocarboniphaga sp. TaxID=2033016 RepID=UPI003D14960B